MLFRKEISKVEVINDISKDVANLYRVLQNHLEEFLRHFKFALCSREYFYRELDQPPELLTDIQRAARFYYIQKLCFSGRIPNPSFGYSAVQPPRFNLLRVEEELSAVHIRLARVYIEQLSYQDVIKKYDRTETFFYIDPPYVGCEDVYGKNIFSEKDHFILADILSRIKGKYLLSQADTPVMRDLYRNFAIDTAKVRYSCGNKHRPLAQEVLISNY